LTFKILIFFLIFRNFLRFTRKMNR